MGLGDLKWLSELGPGGLLSLLLALIVVGVWVPRWVWRREANRADRAEEAAQKNTATIADLTLQVQLLRAAIASLADALDVPSGGGRHRAPG